MSSVNNSGLMPISRLEHPDFQKVRVIQHEDMTEVVFPSNTYWGHSHVFFANAFGYVVKTPSVPLLYEITQPRESQTRAARRALERSILTTI